ncbi:hypothetical protein ACH46N_24735 [Streptomyces pristinaespiralis]|uniref:Predicted protein n=2 Tax=Streptomyces pristinaespiralis TaxID=38300 RepID=D6X5S8_STRE2|nr:hypothetical protein [Streptomyces pristinaespiralis]ALC22577.1 hypothetical protein SPRI_4271 [Streptomyces pristinaespiralis]EFH31453.1 predicted protein [Streptomyces pristinaespiralis ATCC 25486]QMU14842.1 hypothetical protein H3L99_15540 [Streptomyces pristinaespiralis]
MKIRHVRAIAVFGIALVALTGARGSGGGGCDNSSSSSSSSSGGSHRDDDSGSTGGVSVPGGSGADKAARDITIDECKYDDATKALTAKITINNSGSLDYDYDVTMKFTGGVGGTAVPATASETAIAVAAGASETTVLSTPYTGSGDGSEYTKCEVSRASRS